MIYFDLFLFADVNGIMIVIAYQHSVILSVLFRCIMYCTICRQVLIPSLHLDVYGQV